MKNLTIFILVGIVYVCIEVFFDALTTGQARMVGYSSVWMSFVGGFMGLSLAQFNKYKSIKLFYPINIILGGALITFTELISGIILNKICKFNIWDYSSSTYNFLGQIDALHSICWLIITPFGFWLDDAIKHYMFGDKKPAPFYKYYISNPDIS